MRKGAEVGRKWSNMRKQQKQRLGKPKRISLPDSPEPTGEVGIGYVDLLRRHLCEGIVTGLSYLLEGLIEVALLQ